MVKKVLSLFYIVAYKLMKKVHLKKKEDDHLRKTSAGDERESETEKKKKKKRFDRPLTGAWWLQ